MFLVVIFSGGVFALTCFDSDSSDLGFQTTEVYVPGHAGFSDGPIFKDTCGNDGVTLDERYCTGGATIGLFRAQCPTGSGYYCLVDAEARGYCGTSCTPSTEVCDNQDNDCDGFTDEYSSNLCPSGQTCQNGQCSTTCTSTCSPSGARRCAGGGYQICGNYDSDTCLEWGTAIPCSTGFQCDPANGNCVTSPPSPCFDSDPSNNIYVKSYVDYGGQIFYDSCGEGGVLESECTTSSWQYRLLPCASGETCSNGICVCAPQTEVCDGRDNDCNGVSDEGTNICSNPLAECINGVCREPVVCNFEESEPNNPANMDVFESGNCDILNLTGELTADDVDTYSLQSFSRFNEGKRLYYRGGSTNQGEMDYPPLYLLFNLHNELETVSSLSAPISGVPFFQGILPTNIFSPKILITDNYIEGDISEYFLTIYSKNPERLDKTQLIYLDYNENDYVNINDGMWEGDFLPFDITTVAGARFVGEDNTQAKIMITEKIREEFAPYSGARIISSDEQPEPNEPHSTVYIGNVYSTEFSGLADQVDILFNLFKDDNAIVFALTITGFPQALVSLDNFAIKVADVASHEIGHLLGLYHTVDSSHSIMSYYLGYGKRFNQRVNFNPETSIVWFEENELFYQNEPQRLIDILGLRSLSACGGQSVQVTSSANPSTQIYQSGNAACQSISIGRPCLGMQVNCNNVDGGDVLWLPSTTTCYDNYPFNEDPAYEDCMFRALCNTCAASSGGGGSGNTGCFLPGTKVETLSGSRPIEKLVVDDVVKSFADGKITYSKVINIFKVNRDGYYIVKTKNHEVRATAEHPFFTEKGYVEVKDLKIGDRVFVEQSESLSSEKIKSIDYVNEQTDAYNLEVESPHTFFADGFAVHNKEGGGGIGPISPVPTGPPEEVV